MYQNKYDSQLCYRTIILLVIAFFQTSEAAQQSEVRALITAIQKGSLETIEDILTKSPSVINEKDNVVDNTPLYIAVGNGNTAVAQLLLDQGDFVNDTSGNDYTLLHLAVSQKDTAMVKLLLEKGALVNKKDGRHNTPLHMATELNCSIDVIQLLLDKGAVVNDKNRQDTTPLYYAVENGNAPLVQLLLDKGALNRACQELETPLYRAVTRRNKTLVQLLLRKNFTLNERNQQGETPLLRAVLSDEKDLVQLLLDKGAPINDALMNEKEIEHDGMTPLHFAAGITGNAEIVQLLVNRGASVNEKDKNGHTPLYYAQEKGFAGIVTILTKGPLKELPSVPTGPASAQGSVSTPQHKALNTTTMSHHDTDEHTDEKTKERLSFKTVMVGCLGAAPLLYALYSFIKKKRPSKKAADTEKQNRKKVVTERYFRAQNCQLE